MPFVGWPLHASFRATPAVAQEVTVQQSAVVTVEKLRAAYNPRLEVIMPVYPDARELGRRWFEEVWNARRDESIAELMTPDSIGHVEGGEYRGPDGFREMQRVFLSALPDVQIELEAILADDHCAAVRWRARGTHTGDGFGFPASNRCIDIQGTTWLVVKDGRIVEGWDTWNLAGMVASLAPSGEAPQPPRFDGGKT